jgi:hypothetical protein
MTVVSGLLLLAASTPSVRAVAYLAGGLAALAIYVVHARRVDDPVVRLGHLSGLRWRNIHLTSALAVGTGTGAAAYLPVYLKGARGLSAGQAAFSVLFLVFSWTGGAFANTRLQQRFSAPAIIVGGAGLLCTGCGAAWLAVVAEVPLWALLPWFVLVGGGVGLVSTSGMALLQSRAEASEMGRVSSAHQFLRSLGFTYGAALAGLSLFAVIGRQIDDVEAIRDLLGEQDVALSGAARDALQAGYSWSVGTMAVGTALCLLSALLLYRRGATSAGTGADPGFDRGRTG